MVLFIDEIRPCYACWRRKPHLRIETRVLPSGPTVYLMRLAIYCFWLGFIEWVLKDECCRYNAKEVRVDDARMNFFCSIKNGFLDTKFE